MNKTPRILLHNDDTRDLRTKLRTAFPDAKCGECNSYEALPEMIASFQPEVMYSVRFASTIEYPRAALFDEGGPCWIAIGGAGVDHFGMWDASRVTVTNAAGVAADMMAEFAIGGFLHFTLDIPGLQADKAARRWQTRTVSALKGKTILIVGLGHTGRAIAARAKAFGMYVTGTRAHPCDMANVDRVCAPADLLELLPRADFVVVSTPLTDQTRGLIGRSELRAMKQGVIFADVSRGGVTDQTALLQALDGGQIAGAALDVFEHEPLPQSSLMWQLENVIISPHCSSVYEGWVDASFKLFLENLARWIKGQDLLNVVDPGKGY